MAKKNLIRLEYVKGASAKQYTIWLEPSGNKFNVVTQWGRISDDTPEQKNKNAKPLDQANAEVMYAQVVSEKMKKGYQVAKGQLPSFIKTSAKPKKSAGKGAQKSPKKVAKKVPKKAAKKAPKKAAKKAAKPKADGPGVYKVQYEAEALFYDDESKNVLYRGDMTYTAESAEQAEEMLLQRWDNDDWEFFADTSNLSGADETKLDILSIKKIS